MFKLAAIIGGVLLMAGVALAGTMTSLDSTNSPTVGTTPPPAITTARQDDRGRDHNPGPGGGREDNSGHSGGREDTSGHGGGHDD